MTHETTTVNNRSFTRSALAVATIATAAGLAAPANAQRFQRLDGTQMNETSYDVEQTRDAGYVTAGSVEVTDATGLTAEDFYVIKHSKDGTVEWATRFGGPARDCATSIHQTEDGGYIVAGHTESAGPGLGLALLRLDPLGTPIWSHAYEASSFDRVINPADLEYTLQPAVRESRENGDIIVVTNVRNAIGGQHPVYVRTDPAGFPLTNVAYVDSFQNETTFAGFTDLKELDDGTIGISGFWSLADPNPNGAPFVLETDVLALRIDPTGAPLWNFRYDDSEFARSEEAGHGIDVSDDNRLFTIGAIETRDTVTGAPAVTGTQHLELDALTGALTATHFLENMTPAYAATRFNPEFCTITSGIEVSGLAPATGVGPGSAVLLMPSLAGVARYNMYGPASFEAEKLEAVAVTDLTCGYAFTGPKTLSMGLGGSDQFLVKTNNEMESGCFEVQLDPRETKPEVQRIPVEFAPQFRDNWTQWGQQMEWNTNEKTLCFSDRCLPCPADINGDGVVDNGDIGAFVAAFLGGNMIADFNGDGLLDNGDIAAFVAAFLAGC